MSPLKFQDSDVTKGVINGPRPLPLRINKDSHVIHKLPPNQPAAAAAKQSAAAAKRQPVIIYTHSPRVIHTQPNDFMTLVQRLTGMSRDDEDDDVGDIAVKLEAEVLKEEDVFPEEKDSNINSVGSFDERNETTSSVLIDDKRFIGGDVKQDSTVAVSPMYKMSSTFLVEAPLFTPSSSEFFSSPRPNSMFQSPNMVASSISPSFMDYMKAFPDY